MIIEAEKLKKLTEKLRAQGDVTEDEADYIYMLRRIFILYSLSHNRFAKKIVENHFMDMGNQYLENMAEAFKGWYETVYNLVSQNRSGNFISTVVNDSHPLMPYDYELGEQLTGTPKCINEIVRKMSDDDATVTFEKSEITSGNLLSLDIVDCKAQRYGLLTRLKKGNYDPKDVVFLRRMAEKLRDGDISADEAHAIYTIFKYAQSLYVMKKLNPTVGGDKQFETLNDAFDAWYGAVWKRVRQGAKDGNFLYTVPLSAYSMLKAKRYIRNVLKELPDYKLFVPMQEKDIETVSFDISQKWGNEEIASDRYGAVRLNINFDDLCLFSCTDRAGVVLSWMRWKKEDPYEYEYLSRRLCRRLRLINYTSRKCYGIVGKLEYLAEKGVLPVGMMTDSLDRSCIAFHEKDRDIVTRVMSIPDEMIEDGTSVIKNAYDERALIKSIQKSIETSKSFVAVFVQSVMKRREEPDDSWLEVER